MAKTQNQNGNPPVKLVRVDNAQPGDIVHGWTVVSVQVVGAVTRLTVQNAAGQQQNWNLASSDVFHL